MTTKWEYKVLEFGARVSASDVEDLLNTHAKDGWTLHSQAVMGHSAGATWRYIIQRGVEDATAAEPITETTLQVQRLRFEINEHLTKIIEAVERLDHTC